MRLREYLKDKGNYPMIEERIFGVLPGGTPFNTLSGVFGYIDGKLISWDGDSYSLDKDYDRFEEFKLSRDITLQDKHSSMEPFICECKKGTTCLTVWQEEVIGEKR